MQHVEGMSTKNETTPGGSHTSGNPPGGTPTARGRILEALNSIPNNKPGEAVANLAASTVNIPNLIKSSSKLLRLRDPGSPTGGQRTTSAKRAKADQELTGSEQLAEIGVLLDEMLLQRSGPEILTARTPL